MELRTVIARIALSFEVAFADEESAKGYEENMKDYIALQPPSLFLTFIPRK
jgi:hypothetical protein